MIEKEERYGLFSARDPLGANIDVVAVHGLFGNWKTTWQDEYSSSFWLGDKEFWQHPCLQNARVLSYGYNAEAFGYTSVSDIYSSAQELLRRLKGRRTMDGTTKRPIVFVAHSLGGIIVKAAINKAFASSESLFLQCVKGIVFLATPHTGASISELGRRAVNALNLASFGVFGNRQFVSALEKNSPQLHQINDEFVLRTKNMQLRTFYETEKYNNVMIVDKDSACLYLPTNVPAPMSGTHHLNICKFTRATSQTFELLLFALVELAEPWVPGGGSSTRFSPWDLVVDADSNDQTSLPSSQSSSPNRQPRRLRAPETKLISTSSHDRDGSVADSIHSNTLAHDN